MANLVNISEKLKKLTGDEILSLKEKLEEKGYYLNRNNEIVKKSKRKSIDPIANNDSYQVSSAQKRLWILNQLGENNINYNMPYVFILKGYFNETSFRKAYSFIIERHESLRTVFVSKDGEPKQEILDNSDINIDFYDLRNVSNKEKKANEIVIEDLSSSFNLFEGPLIRFILIQIEDRKTILLFNMHHIISDGWSMNILTRDFLEAYNSFKRNIIPDLEPLRIQYKDYSAWQNEIIKSPEIESQRNYWLEKLSGKLPILDLPTDKLRPSIQTFNGAHSCFCLSIEHKTGLLDLCKNNNVSLFMLLQALVKILLHKYTGQTDIIVGSPIAGRVHKELENQIGLYLNNIVLRDIIEPEISFRGFLKNTAGTCTEAFDNQDYPFDRIVEDLDMKRDLSRSSLFDILVILQNNEITELKLDGLTVQPYEIDNNVTTSKYDITFEFSESENEIAIVFKYNTDIYNCDRIDRMGRHFKTLVSSVIDNPEAKVNDLMIIPEEEKNLLLNVFNNTKFENSNKKTIVDLFEEQVEKTPDNIAVTFENIDLSYRELNEKANIVGNYLRENYAIEPEDHVGVLLRRSEKMIIAILGILKSGAAYVPVDPEYPRDRIDFMFEDSNPKVIISEKSKGKFIEIDKVLKNGNNTSNFDSNITLDTHCHIIYTSGTTGQPKGILAKHLNIVNFINWASEYYFDDEIKGNFCLFTSVSYDFSSTPIFLTLLRGKTLFICDQNTDIQTQLQKMFECDYIDSVKLTPAHISLLEGLDLKNSNMRLILTSGEELLTKHVQILHKINKDIRVINGYGTTELPTSCIVKRIDKSDDKILIGKPISNITALILNHNKLVPIGIPGELCVSGSGLATGYLNRTELTNEKFIENPFITGERIYRTGDLAKWLPDGNIEFQGRIDNQVKIRSFRIEPGEIETLLQQYHDIIEAKVLIKNDQLDDKQLVAYYKSEKDLEILEIRTFLSKTLPDYMIPSYFIHMESFPLTPNGKIDRTLFPGLDESFCSGVECTAPRNKIEESLVKIWQEVLGVEFVGVHNNFFELGGHSLKAIKVVTRVVKEMNVELSLKEIFSNPTIESLSNIISISDKKDFLEITPVKEKSSYSLSNAQKRLWILNQLEDDTGAYNMPHAYILEGELNEEAFKKAYSYIIDRHESLRTIFVLEEGDPRQKVLNHGAFGLKIIDLSDYEDIENIAKLMAYKELQKLFDLEKGPLLYFTILKMGEGKNLLLFNMHHIISDGWSMNVLTGELLGAYNLFKENKIPELKPLRINYKDYSAWQAVFLKSSEMKLERDYWLDKLSGEIPTLNIPSDHIRPAVQTYNGNSIDFILSNEINDSLNKLCRKNQASLFMILQAIVKVLFYRYTGQEDIILGSPIAGRVHQDLENQIGFYANTLVFRDKIYGELSFEKFLESVIVTSTDAYDNQNYPFDQLVDDLDIKRDLSRSPLFDVMLTLHNLELTETNFSGLNVNTFETVNKNSKFDISFDFFESETGLKCCIEFNTDIFEKNRIKSMIEHFKTLILSIIEKPSSQIKDLEIMPVAEKNIILKEFNNTDAKILRDRTIIQIFEEQVGKTPNNIAVVYEDVELTYKEVNEKANIVANYLLESYSIKPDDFIGIAMERSEKLLISILGVFKSGAAYIPIDPLYPIDRKLYIIEDSGLDLIIGEDNSLDLLNNNIIDIDEILCTYVNRSNPLNKAKPEDLAYIIYTSGSTGNPKGAMIEHIGMINHIFSKINLLNVTGMSRIVQNASQCFDISVWQLFTALLEGGTTYIYNIDLILNPTEFMRKVIYDKITILEVVPSFLALLLESKDREIILSALEYCLVTGEEVKNNLVKTWFDYFPGKSLVNAYGPTEASDDITHHVMEKAPENCRIPIGKPIQNLNIYIIDNYSKLCPIGIIGEIVVSGMGVGRGYVNNSEKTAQSFIDDPFITSNKVRLYKTGDLGRWLPDGTIEFLGRIDNQVKIRGFRIELGEIENRLIQHQDIQSSVVIANDVNFGDKQIIAYYSSDKELDKYELKFFLNKSLPDYMIPSYFIHMNEFPLTRNGKIDRKLLPEPDYKISTGEEYSAPQNEMEEQLARMWEEILGIDRIGTDDNFFELGGHSLNAIKLVSNINKIFDYQLQLRDLFEYSTIAELAEFISLDENTNDEIILVPIQTKGNKKPLFLISGSFGDVFEFLPLSKFLGENQPIYGLQPVGLNGRSMPFDTMEKIAESYINSIKEIQKEGSYNLGGHSFGGIVAYEMSRQLVKSGDRVDKLLVFDSDVFDSKLRREYDEEKNLRRWINIILETNNVNNTFDLDPILQMDETSKWIALHRLFEQNNIHYPIDMIIGKWNVLNTNARIDYNPQGRILVDNTIIFKAIDRSIQDDSLEYKDLGWSDYISSEIELYNITGNHITIIENPNVKEIAEVIMNFDKSKQKILNK